MKRISQLFLRRKLNNSALNLTKRLKIGISLTNIKYQFLNLMMKPTKLIGTQ